MTPPFGELFVDTDHDAPVDRSSSAGGLWLQTAASPLRAANEDAIGLWRLPGARCVLAVADGMGGAPSGRLAASIALHRLDASLAAVRGDGELRAPILDAFESASREIIALGSGAGTTLLVAELRQGAFRLYHVGDSGALVVGQRGRTILETVQHSPVGYGVAAGLIDPDDAISREDRHFLTNYVGAEDMNIEFGSWLGLNPFDTILLATDGLLDNLPPSEIAESIRCGPLASCAAALSGRAAAAMRGDTEAAKPDDMSFVLFRRGLGPSAEEAA